MSAPPSLGSRAFSAYAGLRRAWWRASDPRRLREPTERVVFEALRRRGFLERFRGRRILVVDETCDTGSTMKLALSEVRALRPAEVRSAVSFKTGEYVPDFYAFETESFIILPWDREIIQGGELIVRPDYADKI